MESQSSMAGTIVFVWLATWFLLYNRQYFVIEKVEKLVQATRLTPLGRKTWTWILYPRGFFIIPRQWISGPFISMMHQSKGPYTCAESVVARVPWVGPYRNLMMFILMPGITWASSWSIDHWRVFTRQVSPNNILVRLPSFVSIAATALNPNLEYSRTLSGEDNTKMSSASPSTLSQSIFKSVGPASGHWWSGSTAINVIPWEDRTTKPEKVWITGLVHIPLPCQFWKALCLSVLSLFEIPIHECRSKEWGVQLLWCNWK